MITKIKNISTEGRNADTIEIDSVSTVEALKMVNKQDKKIAEIISENLVDISKIVDAAVKTINAGGRVIYFGAGTSGRLGVLDASEMLPTFGEGEMFIGLIAGGNKALTTPVENAEDNKEMIIDDLKSINVSKNDLLIGIAASGRTPYVLSGIEYGNKIRATTASISTSKNTLISKAAQLPLEVVVGPETITGSTRMKSGTAQKMVLNMISTITMVKLGKTYSNWMVDVKATNEKLVSRSVNMIMSLLNIEEGEATELFDSSGQNVKVAFVMKNRKLNKNDAVKLLKENNGFLRKVIYE